MLLATVGVFIVSLLVAFVGFGLIAAETWDDESGHYVWDDDLH
jgi:hypothetical protein